MIRRKKIRDYTEKQYRIKKSDEYLAIENSRIRPSASMAFRHKPYVNDYNRLKGCGVNG